MLKKILTLSGLLLVISCVSRPYPVSDCPQVVIPRDKAYMVQKVNYSDDFQIELSGFEAYCYYDDRLNRRTAYITPEFKVYRLRPQDESRVDFEFYTETTVGPPEFLGRRNYFASVNLPAEATEASFRGRQVKVRMPSQPGNFPITLALDVSPAQYRYNQRTFDIKYRYNLPEVQLIEQTIEVDDRPVRFSPPGTVPVFAPSAEDLAAPAEPAAKSGCNSCGR